MPISNIGSKKSHSNSPKVGQNYGSKTNQNKSLKNCIQKRKRGGSKSNFLEKYNPGLRFVKQVRREIFTSVFLKEIVFHVCDRGDVPKIYPA